MLFPPLTLFVGVLLIATSILGSVNAASSEASFILDQNFPGRGRPQIDKSLGFRTILTDQNTLLRGLSLSLDGGDPYKAGKRMVPSLESFQRISKEFGINAVHLYLEGDSSTNPEPVGSNRALADLIVARTHAAGLYLVITVGCNGENGTIHSLQKTLDIWSLYAARYRDAPHVIFEAHNEPVMHTINNFTVSDWKKQLTLYQHIRGLAPDTMILLGSFMSFYDPGVGDTWGADYLADQGVSWENAGFAFHGYWDMGQVEETIEVFQSSLKNPALLCTEFAPIDTKKGFNNMCEAHSIGWLQFEWFGKAQELLTFRERINQSKTIWRPELSATNWPSCGAIQLPQKGERIGLFHQAAKKFIRSDGGVLRADLEAYNAFSNQGFEIIDLGSGRVAIKTDSGRYVSSGAVNEPLVARSKNIGLLEQWQWMQLPSGAVALRAMQANARFVGLLPGDPSRHYLGVNQLYADENQATFLYFKRPASAPK
jgi:hypothetical protein